MPSWCHCHSLSLASVKSSVLPFWYRPTRVVLEKGPLNVWWMCVCVCACVRVCVGAGSTSALTGAAWNVRRPWWSVYSAQSAAAGLNTRSQRTPDICRDVVLAVCWHSWVSIAHWQQHSWRCQSTLLTRCILPETGKVSELRLVQSVYQLVGSSHKNCTIFYHAMLCIRGTSHGPVSMSVSVCYQSEFY